MLKFSKANTKLKKLEQIPELSQFLVGKRKIYSFDLVAGRSCPCADKCLAKVIKTKEGRKIQDGKNAEFRCYAASLEAVFPAVYDSHHHNFSLLRNKSVGKITELIESSMPNNLGICRVHSSGDMFSQDYFDAWLNVVSNHKDRLFYGYTKSLNFWQNRRRRVTRLKNLVLTASRGGRLDTMITKHRFREAVVVFSEKEALDKGLEIDYDDSHASRPDIDKQNFALMIHNTQPKNSVAAKALAKLRKK